MVGWELGGSWDGLRAETKNVELWVDVCRSRWTNLIVDRVIVVVVVLLLERNGQVWVGHARILGEITAVFIASVEPPRSG